jgi:putative ABC transport system permease protein
MQLSIVFSQFWRDLKGQKLRTGLTLFGLGWGTFCVIVLLSFGEGLQRRQQERTGALGDRVVLFWGSRTSLPFEGLPRGRRVVLEEADIDAIVREVSGVSNATAEYSDGTSLKGPAGERSADLCGVRPCFGVMRKIEPEPGGRFFNDTDQAERRRVVVLGSDVKKDVFGDVPAVGQTLQISGVPFLVIGTLAHKEQDSDYNGRDDGKIFIPSSVAQASLGMRYPSNFVIEVAEGVKSKGVAEQINACMARRHHFDPADTEALMTWDIGEMLAMFMTIFLGFKIFLLVLGVFTLAVAGIGVANIMSMVVEDRTSQIGISMALGARRRWVLGQVLMETLLITAVGGSLGILLAALVVTASRALPLGELGSPIFTLQTALLTAGILGIIGVISGLGPARRAALLNPAEALRS